VTQPPVTHPGLEGIESDYFVEQYLPPTITCAWCLETQAHTESDPAVNLTRRIAVGYWNGQPVCAEHAITFDDENLE
jgi:hypothetical protein